MRKMLKYLFLYHFLENRQLVIGHFLRKWLLPPLFKKCGKGLQVRPRVHFESIEKIVLGDNVSFNYSSFINAYGGLTIGNDCLFGPFLTIVTSNHNFNSTENIRSLGHTKKKVTIGNNVWAGANVTILPGVKICDNVVVGAGSVVTKDIPEKSMVAGNPAKIIKKI